MAAAFSEFLDAALELLRGDLDKAWVPKPADRRRAVEAALAEERARQRDEAQARRDRRQDPAAHALVAAPVGPGGVAESEEDHFKRRVCAWREAKCRFGDAGLAAAAAALQQSFVEFRGRGSLNNHEKRWFSEQLDELEHRFNSPAKGETKLRQGIALRYA